MGGGRAYGPSVARLCLFHPQGKPPEVRQGKGKGSVEFWACRVKPGRVMFEIDGVSEELAREAFALGAAKLPIKTKFISRLASEEV